MDGIHSNYGSALTALANMALFSFLLSAVFHLPHISWPRKTRRAISDKRTEQQPIAASNNSQGSREQTTNRGGKPKMNSQTSPRIPRVLRAAGGPRVPLSFALYSGPRSSLVYSPSLRHPLRPLPFVTLLFVLLVSLDALCSLHSSCYISLAKPGAANLRYI